MFKRMSGIFMIFFLLSVYVAPIYGENPTNSQDLNDSVQKVLNHIKSKVPDACEFESSQLLNIMYNHSNQHQGFEFYVQYISGNDVDDLYHKAPYYKQYVDFWDNKLDEYANMTPEERSNELYVVGDKEQEYNRLIEENDTAKLSYCEAKSFDIMMQINETSNKVSKAATEMDVTKLKKLSDEIQTKMNDYYDTFNKASLQYTIQDSGYEYDSDAYNNVVSVRDEISKSRNTYYDVNNYYDPSTMKKYEIQKGNVVQFKVDNDDKEILPIYKYYIVKDIINTGVDKIFEFVAMDLELVKNSGGEIFDTILREKWGNVSESNLNYNNTPYVIKSNFTEWYSTSDLVRAYRTDPTHINSRINQISSKAKGSSEAISIAGMTFGVTLLVTGIVLLCIGIGLACGSAYLGAIGCFTAIGASGFIGAGLGAIAAGIAQLATSLSAFFDIKGENEAHDKDIKDIETIRDKHNEAIFNLR